MCLSSTLFSRQSNIKNKIICLQKGLLNHFWIYEKYAKNFLKTKR